jgi:AraC family transcriptional regulator
MERVLYESDLLALCEFECPAGAPLWHELNTIERGPYVVFPRTSVVIRHVGGPAVLTNANHVMFYTRGQRYTRRLHDPSGDRCIFVRMPTRLIAAVTNGRDEFPFALGPSSARTYLAQRIVLSHLRAGEPDPRFVDEILALTIARAIADAFAVHLRAYSRRSTTAAMHHELVEAAKELLTTRLTERLPLSFFARELYTSEFHLSRLFHNATGFSLHQYRNHLRLRRALETIESGAAPLSSLAHELGFASHSHFTDSFRHVFGFPPSAVARWLTGRDVGEARQILSLPGRTSRARA